MLRAGASIFGVAVVVLRDGGSCCLVTTSPSAGVCPLQKQAWLILSAGQRGAAAGVSQST